MRIEPHPPKPARLQVPGPEHQAPPDERRSSTPSGPFKRPAPRGREEHLRLVWQRRRVEERAPGARPAPIEPEVRLELNGVMKERGLPKSVQSALVLAALYGPEKGPRAGLLRVLRHPGFLRLPQSAAAAFLAAWSASRLAATREYLRLLDGSLAELPETVQVLALRRMSGNELAVRRIAGLLQLAGFRALDRNQQVDLLNVASGPETGAQITRHRRNQLNLAWGARVTSLDRLLRKRGFVSEPAIDQVEELRRFLEARTEEVWLLSATHTNGHSVVVIGDPASKSSISYGHRWVLGTGRRPVARLFNPDPTVRSGWTKPSGQTEVVYAYERLRLTRPELWSFLSWLERNASINSDLRERGPGPAPSIDRSASFWETARETLYSVAARSVAAETPEQGYAKKGVPVPLVRPTEETSEQ